jgi:hypothetical protein
VVKYYEMYFTHLIIELSKISVIKTVIILSRAIKLLLKVRTCENELDDYSLTKSIYELLHCIPSLSASRKMFHYNADHFAYIVWIELEFW